MKKKVISILILIISLSLFAQIEWANEKAIRQGENIEWFRTSATMNDGSIVYVWSDTRFGDRDVWAQRMDSEGNKVWGEVATHVNGEINRQEDPVAIRTTDGGVIVAWVDFRNEDSGDVYAQKIDDSGNLVWDTEGVPLCTATDIQISLNIVPDEDGGAYIIWIDSRNTGGTDIYGTHIESDGSIADGWDDNGNSIISAEGAQNQHTFWQDGLGGAILVWHDDRDPDNENIYMQRIIGNGDLLWAEGGSILCDAAGVQNKPKITPDGSGNFIVTWRDKRDDILGDIYAQRIDLDGNLVWTSEIVVYAGEGVQRNPRIKEASDGGAFIVWEDGRNELALEYKDIYIQKLSIYGDLEWNTDGVEIVVADNDQINPRNVGDFNGGCWIIWEDGRTENHPFGDIYTQHVNANGEIQLETNGKEICVETGFQFSPLVKKSQSEQFLVWGDNRDGSTGIYLQVLNDSGEIQLDPSGEIIFYGLSGNAKDHTILPNIDNQVILWKDSRNASIATQIYYQILNNDGSFGLVEDGQPITTMTNSDQENYDAVLLPDSDEIAVCWEENRDGFKQIFAQAVDSAGNFLWSDSTGIAAHSSYAQQEKSSISALENGGTIEYYIGWEDFTDFLDSAVYGQKIVDGNLAWGEDGVIIADRDGNDELTDIVENYYIWQSVEYGAENIFCKRVDEDGNTATGWDDTGLEVCVEAGLQKNARGIIVPEGILIIWDDFRSGSQDVYGQVVTPDGTTLWADGGMPLVDPANDQEVSNMLFIDQVGLFMVWEDFRSGNYYDIYMQKYDQNGASVWQEDGNEVVVDPTNNQQAPYLTSNGSEFMVFWEDYVSEDESNLLAQYLDNSGNQIWPENGFLISNAIRNQNLPMAVNDGEYSYVIWQDTRSSGKTDIYNIYAQKLNYEPVGIDNNIISNNYNILKQNYPNPFDLSDTGRSSMTTISFDLKKELSQNASIVIYNLKGQVVNKLQIDEMSSSVTWNAKDINKRSVASGIYFYRLEDKGFKSSTKKMVLMK